MLLTCIEVSPDGNPMRLMKVLGHKDRDLLVHHLRDGIAEDPFCSFVNKENGASFVDCYDGIRGSLGYDTEELGGLREPLLAISQSNSFRVPRFRHSRLITWCVAWDAHTRAHWSGAQPTPEVGRDECSITVLSHAGPEERIVQLENNPIDAYGR